MSQNEPDQAVAREAAKDVFREYLRIAATTAFRIGVAVFGLLITASSFNRSNVILIGLGCLLGIGMIGNSLRGIYRTYR